MSVDHPKGRGLPPGNGRLQLVPDDNLPPLTSAAIECVSAIVAATRKNKQTEETCDDPTPRR
jgi:hypothetical protein